MCDLHGIRMNEADKFALVPRPPGALEKAEPGATRVLGGMVKDALVLARSKVEAQNIPGLPCGSSDDLETWFQKGVSYYYGNGAPKDYAEAARWFRKAAERGHASSQLYLGLSHYDGSGLPQDYVGAASWYRKAAEQGNAIAQKLLGDCYAKGNGVNPDLPEAVKWYRKAAHGDDSAQKNLADLHATGQRDVTTPAMAPTLANHLLEHF